MNEHMKMNAPIRHVLLMLNPEEPSSETCLHARCRFTVQHSQVSPAIICSGNTITLVSPSGSLDISC